jgi:hypothetical protein
VGGGAVYVQLPASVGGVRCFVIRSNVGKQDVAPDAADATNVL